MSNPATPQLSASSFDYVVTAGNDVTESLLETCAALFSTNYGIWDEKGRFLPGKRVRMPAQKLRAECLSAPESSVVVTCTQQGSEDIPIGHAFATVWSFSSDGGNVGWVTQLVVNANFRRRGIATNLLRQLKTHKLFSEITAIGIASSHPASVNALANFGPVKMNMIDTDFISRNARRILAATPVKYLNAELRGSLFEENSKNGAISCVDTKFYVDHRVLLEVLDTYKKNGRWVLGELLEGHEFLLIIPIEKSSDV